MRGLHLSGVDFLLPELLGKTHQPTCVSPDTEEMLECNIVATI